MPWTQTGRLNLMSGTLDTGTLATLWLGLCTSNSAAPAGAVEIDPVTIPNYGRLSTGWQLDTGLVAYSLAADVVFANLGNAGSFKSFVLVDDPTATITADNTWFYYNNNPVGIIAAWNTGDNLRFPASSIVLQA